MLTVLPRNLKQRCGIGFISAHGMTPEFPLNETYHRVQYQHYLIATNGGTSDGTNGGTSRVANGSADAERPISKQLLACRSTKDFIKYANQRGAVITINSNHAKVAHNGVWTILQSPGRKHDLNRGARVRQIQAFKDMGIAWDD